MHREIEIIREHLSPTQVMEIRKEAKAEGKKVNITRMYSGLVEIEIITQSINNLVDITPTHHNALLAH